MDVISDLIQIENLFKNCHNWLCLGSIGILFSSYLTTSLYLKYFEGLKWSKALIYPSLLGYVDCQKIFFIMIRINCCRGKLWKYIVSCWNGLMNGREMPDLSSEDDNFIKKISFLEVISESLPQLTFSNIIIRVYGVSDDMTTKFFQLFSLASSMLSLIVAFISVSE